MVVWVSSCDLPAVEILRADQSKNMDAAGKHDRRVCLLLRAYALLLRVALMVALSQLNSRVELLPVGSGWGQ